MAKQTLPTNYKDDVLAAAMNGKRRYILEENADGTFSLIDATTYTQVGSAFGQAALNAICTAVNESADKAKIIDLLSSVAAVTENGYIMGAKAGAELYKNLSTMQSNFQAGCSTIAAAITAMGVATANNASPATMAANIKKIQNAAFGSYVSSSTTRNTVVCGFQPSKVIIINSDTGRGDIIIYDSRISTSQILCAYSNSGVRLYSFDGVGGGGTFDGLQRNPFQITPTGFSLGAFVAYEGQTMYWIAVK